MDQWLYLVDQGPWLGVLRHAWPWATVTALLAVASAVGIVAIVRRYEATRPKPGE